MMRGVRNRLSRHRHLTFASLFPDSSSEELPSEMRASAGSNDVEAVHGSVLYVKVSHAGGLLAMDSNGKSDPFCVIHVGSKRHKTSTKMRNLEPVWNETFTFRQKDVIRAEGRVLFELFDKDQWTSNDFLGRAELNVHEVLMLPEQIETVTLKLTRGKWSNFPSILGSKHRDQDLGQVSIAHISGLLQESLSACRNELYCHAANCFSRFRPTPYRPMAECCSQGRVNKEKVSQAVANHPRSLPSIVHTSRGSIFEEPVTAALLLQISQVELNLDPCAVSEKCYVSKCILRKSGLAAKRHVSRVLGNLVQTHARMTRHSTWGRSSTADSASSLSDSTMSHAASFFDRFVMDETDDEDDHEAQESEPSDDALSSISEVDARQETLWYYEVRLFDQKRSSESVGYILNSGLKMDFDDPVVFVVQLPLPNVMVDISMCKKSEHRRQPFRVSLQVPLFDIMDAGDGVFTEFEKNSMTINYRLIPLDVRPRVIRIQTKLDLEERPLSPRTSIPEDAEVETSAGESSDLSPLLRSPAATDDLGEFDRDPDVLVGKLSVFLDEVDLPNLKSNVHSCFCILKCQHHWAMTNPLSPEQPLTWKWVMKLPVYDPATVISLSIFTGTGRLGQCTRLGKLRVRLSTLQPDRKYDNWLPFISDGAEVGRAKLGLRVKYPSETNLMMGYVKSPFQKEIYDYGLAAGTSKSIIRKEHRNLIMQWLDTSEPRISKQVSRHVLDLEKESFSRKRFTMHIRRIQSCFAFTAAVSPMIAHLQSWESPCQSAAVCIAVWLVVWNLTATAVLALLVMFWAVSLQYRVPSAPLSMADPVLMPAVGSETPSAQPERQIEIANPYAALKSRYDQIQTILVKIQKILDTIASFCERIHALVSWKDPIATRLLTVSLMLAAVALSVLGLRFCICFAICWFLRPPFLRTPLPPPPLNFFKRLPSKSDQIL